MLDFDVLFSSINIASGPWKNGNIPCFDGWCPAMTSQLQVHECTSTNEGLRWKVSKGYSHLEAAMQWQQYRWLVHVYPAHWVRTGVNGCRAVMFNRQKLLKNEQMEL